MPSTSDATIEKFAEEEKETGRQRTTIHLAKLAEGEVPIIDVSTFLELDGADPEEDERTRTEAQEQFTLWFAPILAKKKSPTRLGQNGNRPSEWHHSPCARPWPPRSTASSWRSPSWKQRRSHFIAWNSCAPCPYRLRPSPPSSSTCRSRNGERWQHGW